MEDIADSVSQRHCKYAIHFFRNLTYSNLDAPLDYAPTRHHSPDLADSLDVQLHSIKLLTQLLDFAKTELPDTFEFWLFLDEAQMRYDDNDLWGNLMGLPHRFYIVAAGSYGSHTGSASHSPPAEPFPPHKRMNLFPLPSEPSSKSLCVAFTPIDFSNYVAQLEESQGIPLCEDIRNRIKDHSSNKKWNTWYHPGVASTLASLVMLDKVRLKKNYI